MRAESEGATDTLHRIHHLTVTVIADIIITGGGILSHRRWSLTDIKAATKVVSIIKRSTRNIIIRDLILHNNPLLLDPLLNAS